ncbi:hypothetical protein PIB30_014125 [Stylosanthes scabra]|uniref:Uncharacterized protein n=1 Tax=Stylosanthes scabra TaxID=79078 RepID=A0ABU6T6U8_9FABA|nr:hypothetical protein [Stylosanthes scabra]
MGEEENEARGRRRKGEREEGRRHKCDWRWSSPKKAPTVSKVIVFVKREQEWCGGERILIKPKEGTLPLLLLRELVSGSSLRKEKKAFGGERGLTRTASVEAT